MTPRFLRVVGTAEEERQLLRALVEGNPNALLITDRAGRIQLANPRCTDLFGYEEEELLGSEVGTLVPVASRDVHGRLMESFASHPTARAMGEGRELHAVRKDGREVPVEIGLIPVETAGGLFVIVSVIDVTERRIAERAAHEGEERFRLLVEGAPSAILVATARGRITLVNSAVEELFGYDRTELVGQSVEKLIPGRFAERHPELRAGFVAEPSARPMGLGRDLFGLRKDGTEVPIEIGLNPLATSKGMLVVASIIDLTERKRIEARLRESLTEKETLLREVHHRVKNNLQVISSMLRLQIPHLQNAHDKAVFDLCVQRVRGMAMVHEMLYRSGDFAKLDFGLHVKELVHLVVATSGPAHGGIRTELDLSPVHIDMDTAVPLGLLVHEVVANALKHAFPDGRAGVVRISLREEHGDLVLQVKDDGVGLSEGGTPGTRLGMTMVTGLVRQLRGRIQVTEGPGATVEISVPLKG